jgi:hypothetical protein
MGFNKRYVSLESILSAYKVDSIQGLHRYFSADALIGGSNCSHIMDLYFSGRYDELIEELESEIKKSESSD